MTPKVPSHGGVLGPLLLLRAFTVILLICSVWHLLLTSDSCWSEEDPLAHVHFKFPKDGTNRTDELASLFHSGIPLYALPESSVWVQSRRVCMAVSLSAVYCSERNLNPLSPDWCLALPSMIAPTVVVCISLLINTIHLCVLFDPHINDGSLSQCMMPSLTLIMSLTSVIMIDTVTGWDRLWSGTPFATPSFPSHWTATQTFLGCLLFVAVTELSVVTVRLHASGALEPIQKPKRPKSATNKRKQKHAPPKAPRNSSTSTGITRVTLQETQKSNMTEKSNDNERHQES